MLEDDQYDRNM